MPFGLEKVASFRSGQRKTFTMWANSKLIQDGHDPISVDNMAMAFADGTVLCYLLESLSGKKIRGIDRRPRNPLQISSNLAILWRFMKTQEGIELGGINTTDIQKGSEKIVLALLWRYILMYDLSDDDVGATDGLLEWVQPKCEAHYDVQNFTSSWKDGVALMALFDNIRPGIVDMAEVVDNGDVEANLSRSFELFEEHLGVAKFLEVTDLMVPRPDKKSVMTYIAAIRNAANKDAENQRVAAESANAGHVCRGSELYEQGLAKYAQASADDESHMDDIVKDAIPEIEDCDGTQAEYDRIIEESLEKLKEATQRYDSASGKFEEAKTEFGLVDDGSADEWVTKCDDKLSEVDKHKRDLEETLTERLKTAVRNAKGKKKLEESNKNLDEAIEDAGISLEQALSDAYDKIEKAKTEQDRIDACDEAREKVKGKTKVFGEVKEGFEEAERLLDEGEDHDQAVEKIQLCDDLVNQLLETLDDKLADFLESTDINDDMNDADLLAQYHAFSIQVQQLLDESAPSDVEISREKGVSKKRLDEIAGLVKALKGRDAGMRAQLHAALDASIDAQGY